MKLRMRFSKIGKVRFTSHRDVARMWERALRKAGLRAAYTAGFSPRPKFAFGLALPTGAESLAEYLDVELVEEEDIGGLPRRLSTELPEGIDVTAVAPIETGALSLQESVSSCSWKIEAMGMDVPTAEALTSAAMRADALVLTRSRKGREVTDDLRPALLHVSVSGPTAAGSSSLLSSASIPAVFVPPNCSSRCRPTARCARDGCCGRRNGLGTTAPGASRWRRRALPERISMSEPQPHLPTTPDGPAQSARMAPAQASPPPLAPPPQTSPAPAPQADEGEAAPRSRRRGSRGGRGRARRPSETEAGAVPAEGAAAAPAAKPRIGDSRPAPVAPPSASAEAPAERRSGNRRRRGGRGRSGGGSGTPSVEVAVDPELLEQRKGRERKGRPVGRYLMCVHVRPEATQVAVLEGRSLIEHYVSRPQDDASQIHGNIYLGRVQNVLPGMEAAFIDIGTPKNAVLYRGDVTFDADDVEGPADRARIEDVLRAKQTIVCQVTKNPIGAKGARLTQEVSLPGRFVVLIPNSSTYGISKRLADDERKRLRSILDKIKPSEHGLIVRTAAAGASRDELERDVALLLGQWKRIEEAAAKASRPALLYREPDLAVRVIREEFNSSYRGVVIDDRALFEEIRDYVANITPELSDRVEFHDPDVEDLPLFEQLHVHEQLHKALDRKVWLPSGGSLIIERTEALTVIDVNTGKNVGRSNLEQTVFDNNMEAAEEVARQLRLRDIGGIIVIDFIDMEIRKNRDEVVRAFRDALARDKTRTQVFDISELGLVEMTRKRIGEGLLESMSVTCPTCDGRGIQVDQALLS